MMHNLLNLPLVASEHGKDVDQLMVLVHWLMFLLFVGWSLFFIYTLFRFRSSVAKKADHFGVRGHASTWLEVGVASFEAVLLIGFAVPLWAKVVDDFPSEKDALIVRVVAEQFSWNYIYPGADGKFGKQDLSLVTTDNPFGFDKTDAATKDNVQVLNELHVPVGKPVILNLSSKDVIHSFKVVPLRVTQDCIPGLNIPTHFVPNKEGKYQVICAQLCGNGHASMANGVVVVDSEQNFKQWMASKSAGGGAATSFE
ncbi:MAG: cytochrome c oxidase subunit II [Verrucomicrobiales bacterium]|nr:cytochrome c oxidase subunit II [Verrucomicrobiales bacterium]